MRLISVILLVFLGVAQAADITATTGWTCATTAPASVTIDAGSNRKHVYVITQEVTAGPTITLTTIGGQSPTETVSYDETTPSPPHYHYYHIFNETAIAAMSGTNVVESGSASTEYRCYGTIEDTDQANLTSHTGQTYSSTGTTMDVTTTSSSGDYVLVTAITNFLRNFDGWDTLAEIADVDTGAQTHGYAGGDGGDNTTTVTISSSVGKTGAALVFPNATAGVDYALFRRRDR